MLLSNSCLVLPAVVKQQQKEISHNQLQTLFAVSVYRLLYPVPELSIRSYIRPKMAKQEENPSIKTCGIGMATTFLMN